MSGESRQKTLSGGRLSRPELSPISGQRGGCLSAVPGRLLVSRPHRAAACQPSRAGGSAARRLRLGRPAMARRCGRWVRSGRGRRNAAGEVAALPPTARPCRAAGDGGRAAWPLGTAGTPKPAHAAPPAPGSKGAGAARAGLSDRPADR